MSKDHDPFDRDLVSRANIGTTTEAILSDFTWLYDSPEERDRRLHPSYEYKD
jgi:hypothetical protein